MRSVAPLCQIGENLAYHAREFEPVARARRGDHHLRICSGNKSITKCSSGTLVNMQVCIDSTGPDPDREIPFGELAQQRIRLPDGTRGRAGRDRFARSDDGNGLA